MFNDLYDINVPEGANIGGLLCFKFAPTTWIESVPKTYKGEILTPVVFKTGYTWLEGWAEMETLQGISEMNKDKNGTFYENKIKGIVPKALQENTELYHRMRNLQFVVVTFSSNGERELYGTVQEGLDFKADKYTGSAYSNLNHHTIEFAGNTTAPATNYLIV